MNLTIVLGNTLGISLIYVVLENMNGGAGKNGQ